MPNLDFGNMDIGGNLAFDDFDSDGLTYDAEVGVIDTEHLSLTVVRTEGGVWIYATDPRGNSEGQVYDGYTPVKGVDYFTQEDIEEIKAAVIADLTSTYVYEQLSASSSWSIAHNMGKYPSVTVVDSGGSLVVGEVTYINDNSLTVSFAYPFSGKAYLN